MDSKRLAVLKALCAHLVSEISIANGYKHDLAADAVWRGRVTTDDDDPLPSISILENVDPDRYARKAGGDTEAPTTKEGWIILIQGWVEDDKINPTDPAYELMADVKKALACLLQRPNPQYGGGGHPNCLLGNLIAGMTIEPGTVRPPIEQVSERAFFWLRVTLDFVEDQTDPYNLN